MMGVTEKVLIIALVLFACSLAFSLGIAVAPSHAERKDKMTWCECIEKLYALKKTCITSWVDNTLDLEHGKMFTEITKWRED